MLELNRIYNMDCIEGMKLLDDNSIDAIVTDPPYELGFMGKQWDASGIAYNVDMWKQVLRVLKPGGYLLSFGGTRTYHRMAVAIEDAGFQIRDMIEWVYGCLSEDTEILTPYGWEHYNRNIYKYPILIYDNGIYKWEIPKKWNEYKVNDTCYRIKSNNTDQLVSRNHRVAVEQKGKLIFKFAETLEQQENIPFLESVPSVSETLSNFYKRTSDEEQNLFYEMCKIINQKPKEKRDKIFSSNNLSSMWKYFSDKEKQTLKILFNEMQWKNENKRFTKNRKTYTFNVGENKENIKSKVFNGKESCMERWSNLFQNSWKLFGSEICPLSERIYRYGEKGWLCNGTPIDSSTTSEKEFIENGSNTSQRPQSREQQDRELNSIQEQQGTQNSRGYGITRAKVTKEEYSGMILCPTVSTGCFVARRKGKIFITGNSGFPKSLNIGVAIDKLQGNERELLATETRYNEPSGIVGVGQGERTLINRKITKGTSEWEGWGTALKPAHEPICMARKPLSEKTVAENCLKWGTGGINIDESRVESSKEDINNLYRTPSRGGLDGEFNSCKVIQSKPSELGRFPANLITDGSEEVRECFPESGGGKFSKSGNRVGGNCEYSVGINGRKDAPDNYGDSGNASRFFKSIPNHEPICMARKPLSEKTVAENCLKWGTGGINIDGSRVETFDDLSLRYKSSFQEGNSQFVSETATGSGKRMELEEPEGTKLGRFPANLIHDNSEEVRECFPETKSTPRTATVGGTGGVGVNTNFQRGSETSNHNDSGNASRFFKSIPNHEPICMARKPLSEKTVAENCLKWGTGGINIDESRVGTEVISQHGRNQNDNPAQVPQNEYKPNNSWTGRFPANLIHDNSEEVRECFPDTKSVVRISEDKDKQQNTWSLGRTGTTPRGHNDSGNSSRFFKSIVYVPKASKSERNAGCEGLEEKIATARMNASEFRYEKGREPTPRAEQSVNKNNHPTVKPIALMEYLIKMVTPKDGVVLDPFIGSGTTAIAAYKEHKQFIGFEKEAEYFKIAEARIKHHTAQKKLI